MRRPLRALTATAGVCASVALLAACAGRSHSGDFVFHGAQKTGTFIPVAQREHAESFSGTLLDGKPFDSASEAGKVTVVNFWAQWCPPCAVETPQFDIVYRAVRSKGVRFVGIDTKDTHSGGSAFVADHHISYPIVFDEQGKISSVLGGTNLPSLPYSILIDRQGRVAGVYSGPLAPADIQPMLTRLEAET